jgi:hypothetical protein
VQQQARGLDAARAEEQRRRALPVLDAVVDVDDGRDLAALVDVDAGHRRVRPDLGSVRDRARQVGDVHADLGAVAAALVAAAAADTGVPQAGVLLVVVVRDQGLGGVRRADADGVAAAHHHVRGGVAPGGRVRVAPRGIPRVVARAGDADEGLDLLDVAGDLGGVDGPVDGQARDGPQVQVALVGPGHEGAPVQGRPADAPARVVRAERVRVLAVAEALVHPVDGRARLLVVHVLLGVEVRPRLDRDDAQAGRCQLRQQGRASCAGAHDDGVDDLVVPVGGHVVELHRAASVGAASMVGSQASRASAASSWKPWNRGPSPPFA